MKKYFLAGILVWAPLAVTIWVISSALSVLDGVFGSLMIALITVLPSNLTQELQHFREIPFVGVVIDIVGGVVSPGSGFETLKVIRKSVVSGLFEVSIHLT